LIFTRFPASIGVVKHLIIASLLGLLLSSCGTFKKEEVGPYGDKRSNWEKFRSYEEENYDDWWHKMTSPTNHRRKKEIHGNKKNP
jgi:hypothetical protein